VRLKAQLPDIPDLIRITVDHSDDGVLIQWEASTSTNIRNYHIYKRINPVDFVKMFTLDPYTFEYKHMTSGLENLAYAVTAEDSTGSESIFGENVQQAVAVSTEFDICTQSNIITWTPYLGWEGNISGYRVFGGISGSGMQELMFVPATTNSYTHADVLADTEYTYYIETINTNGITSLSPIDTVFTTYPEAPSYLTIDHVTVLDESNVEIQYSADIAGPVTSFILLRRSNPGSSFTEVNTRWNIMESTQVVQDQFQTANISYQYLVESVFQPVPCNTEIKISESNTGNSILLINDLNNQIVTLNWTAYESYEPGLAGYLIQRNTGDGQFVDLETLGPLSTQWSENIQALVNGSQQGEIQYRVIALSNPDREGNEEQSISNVTSVLVETQMQVPSAFTPGSNDINAEFKPLMDFAPRDYVMIVMDRGGRKMFETTEPGEGWDGRFNGGDFVQEAVYVYYIEYTDYTGLLKTFTGNVTVLYP
jgi:gliding motility-associated-like protein